VGDHHVISDFVPVMARQTLRAELAHIVERHVSTKLSEIYSGSGRVAPSSDGAFQFVVEPNVASAMLSPILSSSAIDELTEAFIGTQAGAFLDELERLGLSSLLFPAFLAQVVDPMMRALGDMWCDDKASFLAVSIATERLRMAVEAFYPDDDFKLAPNARRILITGFETPQHNFGGFLLGKVFAYNGWLVESCLWNEASGSALGLAQQRGLDVFAMSVGIPYSIERLSGVIEKLRATAKNSSMLIAIGGVGPALHSADFAELAVDFTASDAFVAVELANSALAERRAA
jgi:methanogenic corrinoid protein MtbC1